MAQMRYKMTDKEIEDFLWDRVAKKASGFWTTRQDWDPLISLEDAWMMEVPMREAEVHEFPLYLALVRDGDAYHRATVHHEYDFMPVYSAIDESPARAVCKAVVGALKELDEKTLKRPAFWQMWQKPETPKVGVGVVLRDRDHRVLLGLRKGSHGAGEWSLPGGHMELGEGFFAACRREVLEETGIGITSVNKIGFTNDVFEKDGLHYVTLFFDAGWDGCQKAKDMEPDKTERWEWFCKEELACVKLFPPSAGILDVLFVDGMR